MKAKKKKKFVDWKSTDQLKEKKKTDLLCLLKTGKFQVVVVVAFNL